MAKLKVYRTPIGFHDAYVAAPSQKAALQAWGSAADLFARGQAEMVEDPALAAEPLAHPGEVIRRSRGSAAEQLAALPPDRPKAATQPTRTARQPKKAPRPTRDALDAAERALADAQARRMAEDKALAAEEAALRQRRERARADQAATIARLDRARAAAERAYAAALEAWRAVGWSISRDIG